MLVVVIAVQGVPVRAVEVVDVIAVLDSLMPASIAMGVVMNLGEHVSARRVFVVMVAVQMVRMAVMQVIDVAIVFHRDVAARGPVPVIVVGVGRVGGHEISVLS